MGERERERGWPLRRQRNLFSIFIYLYFLGLQLNFKNKSIRLPPDIDSSSFSQQCWEFSGALLCSLAYSAPSVATMASVTKLVFLSVRVFFFITKLLNLQQNWIWKCSVLCRILCFSFHIWMFHWFLNKFPTFTLVFVNKKSK